MEILGIGPLELVFILIIALIVLGPNDMVKAGRTIGRFLRKLVTSPTWRTVQQTSRDLRYLPNRLMREAGLEDLKDQIPDAGQIRKELNLDEMKKETAQMDREISKGLSDWTTPPLTIKTPEQALAPADGQPAVDPSQQTDSQQPAEPSAPDETPLSNEAPLADESASTEIHTIEPPTVENQEEPETTE